MLPGDLFVVTRGYRCESYSLLSGSGVTFDNPCQGAVLKALAIGGDAMVGEVVHPKHMVGLRLVLSFSQLQISPVDQAFLDAAMGKPAKEPDVDLGTFTATAAASA